MPDAVFFDVDGVLIDSITAKGEAFVDTFADYPENAEWIRQLHQASGGVARDRKIAMILERICPPPLDPAEVERRTEFFASTVVDRVLSAHEMPGASATLAELSVECPLHAVSATPITELAGIIDHRGWKAYFRSFHGTPPGKSELVRALIALNSYRSESCIFVGDSAEDRDAARSNGVPFILVTGSIDVHPDDLKAVPDLVGLPGLVRKVCRTSV